MPFDYDERLITIGLKESLKNSLIKKLFDNWKCGSNLRNVNLDGLHFDYYQSFIIRQTIDIINDDTVEGLNNVLIFDVYKKVCKNNESLVWRINWLTIESVNVIIERLKFITYILVLIFVLSIKDQSIIE